MVKTSGTYSSIADPTPESGSIIVMKLDTIHIFKKPSQLSTVLLGASEVLAHFLYFFETKKGQNKFNLTK